MSLTILSGAASSNTISIPTHSKGDLIVVVGANFASADISTPSGYAQIDAISVSTRRINWFLRVGNGEAHTVTASGSTVIAYFVIQGDTVAIVHQALGAVGGNATMVQNFTAASTSAIADNFPHGSAGVAIGATAVATEDSNINSDLSPYSVLSATTGTGIALAIYATGEITSAAGAPNVSRTLTGTSTPIQSRNRLILDTTIPRDSFNSGSGGIRFPRSFNGGYSA
jgi:hypothetical protein